MAGINRRDALSRHRRLLRDLGEHLRVFREDAGRSQRAVARAAGIAQGHLSGIEAGTAEPSTEVLDRIGASLGLDLAVRYFPTTGPRVRDRLQLPMEQAVLAIAHPRYLPHVEVLVSRPVRGVIDLVLHDRTQPVTVATELHSQIRRAEQQIRWAKEKADALAARPELAGRRVPRLLVLRNTGANRDLIRSAPDVFRAAYPGRAADAYAALVTGDTAFPEAAILWVTLKAGAARVLEASPRGVSVGR